MRKLLICTPKLGTFSAFHYMFYIFLSGLLLHIVRQGSAVLAAGAGRVGYIYIYIFHLSSVLCPLGDG